MTPHTVSSPVSLSYVAALRGLTPRKPGAPFAYAMAGCKKPWLLLCLAASNSEGKFYGLMSDDPACAAKRRNKRAPAMSIMFLFFQRSFEDAVLHNDRCRRCIICAPMKAKRRFLQRNAQPCFDLAEEFLLPGGLFQYSYRAYTDERRRASFSGA